MARTTINITKEVREALKGKKKYAKESYDEVLQRLMRKAKNKRGLIK